MQRIMLKSKIHRAVVTQTELSYEGSLTVDPVLLEAADMLPGERVQVVNLNNGSRIETYLIEGERGKGDICLNGPAARCGCTGDTVIILTYAAVDEQDARTFSPRIVFVDEPGNAVKEIRE